MAKQPQPRQLHGRVALVTGGGRRIGSAIALALGRAGAGVVVHYRRSKTEAEQICTSLRNECEVEAWMVQADLSDAAELQSLIPRATELAGRLDVLINNASTFPADGLDDLSLEGLMSSITVNTWAPFQLTRLFAQRSASGTVVNLLDSRLRGYDWAHVSYIVAKRALELLTRMSALRYAPNVTVNAVAPGLILPPPGKDESYLNALANTVPMRKHGTPQDIADAVLFLATSSFITGQVIYVDGGRHLREYTDGPHPH